MILTVGSLKGGTGKTTLALNLGVKSALSDMKTLIVDSDSQSSLSHWALVRQAANHSPSVQCLQVLGKELAGLVEAKRDQYDVIIIDVPGGESVELRGAMTISDLLLVPIQPNQLDLWTLEKLLSIYEKARKFNSNLLAKVVLNRSAVRRSSNQTTEAITAIESIQKGLYSGVAIKERSSLQHSVMAGLSVYSWQPNDMKACEEIDSLWECILATQISGKSDVVVPFKTGVNE